MNVALPSVRADSLPRSASDGQIRSIDAAAREAGRRRERRQRRRAEVREKIDPAWAREKAGRREGPVLLIPAPQPMGERP